jgi:hypothetical protein
MISFGQQGDYLEIIDERNPHRTIYALFYKTICVCAYDSNFESIDYNKLLYNSYRLHLLTGDLREISVFSEVILAHQAIVRGETFCVRAKPSSAHASVVFDDMNIANAFPVLEGYPAHRFWQRSEIETYFKRKAYPYVLVT